MKVTNNSKAPQGLHTVHGLRYLQPGESKELELDTKHAERAGRLEFLKLKGDPVEVSSADEGIAAGTSTADGVFLKAEEFNRMRESFESLTADNKSLREQLAERDAEIAKLKGGKPDDDKPSERDELKKQADELKLEYPGNISNAKLKEMIDAKLAE